MSLLDHALFGDVTVLLILQSFTALYGVYMVGFSLFVALQFWRMRDSARLGNAFGFQLSGEAVVGFFAVLFSTLTVFPLPFSLTPVSEMAMRICMFTMTHLTTRHLYHRIKTIRAGGV